MKAEVAIFGFTLKPVTYTYLVPPQLKVHLGQLVQVPFGKNQREGIVVSMSREQSSVFDLKEISGVETNSPVITPHQLKLAFWIADHYSISVAEGLKLTLPRLPKIGLEKLPISSKIEQELILFPTLRQAQKAAEIRHDYVLTNTLPARTFDKYWVDIRSGSIKKVFGTRSALFAPFLNLTKITLFQPESDLYKDERRPYYRSFDVALELAKISGAELKAVSFSPRVQDEFRLPHQIKSISPLPKSEIIDLRGEHIVNHRMLNLIKNYENKKILVFLNRKSEKGPLVCRTCKTHSYVDDPSVCPNCGSSDVKFQKYNLQSLSKELSSKTSAQMTFATQEIFFRDHGVFDLVLVLSSDTYLSSGKFDSAEKTFQLITNLMRMVAPQGQITIQTAHPSHPSLVLALNNGYAAFYHRELSERKETNYPPFSSLAKLTYAKKDVPIPEIVDSTYIEVFGPFTDKFPYYVLRYQKGADLSIFQRPWRLDLDPLSL